MVVDLDHTKVIRSRSFGKNGTLTSRRQTLQQWLIYDINITINVAWKTRSTQGQCQLKVKVISRSRLFMRQIGSVSVSFTSGSGPSTERHSCYTCTQQYTHVNLYHKCVIQKLPVASCDYGIRWEGGRGTEKSWATDKWAGEAINPGVRGIPCCSNHKENNHGGD